MAYTCPRCGRTSHHPEDERQGYCGACRDWAGPLLEFERGAWQLSEAVGRLLAGFTSLAGAVTSLQRSLPADSGDHPDDDGGVPWSAPMRWWPEDGE